MKLCQAHFASVKQAIDDKGMMHLVKDADNAVERLQAELNGETDDTTYDPLLDACAMISTKALELGGLYLLGHKPGDNGEYCPLCEVEQEVDVRGAAAAWIEGCTDAIFDYCKSRGLLNRPN